MLGFKGYIFKGQFLKKNCHIPAMTTMTTSPAPCPNLMEECVTKNLNSENRFMKTVVITYNML